MLSSRYLWLLGLALIIIAGDQFSKQWAYDALGGRPPLEILPIFSLTLAFNQGAAFSFLGDAGGWQRWFFVSLAVVFSTILVVWIWREHRKNGFLAIGLSLILGGAIGNLIDRWVSGYVIDFLSLHYAGWYFPIFNVADIAITLGAIILIIDQLFFSRESTD